MMMKRRRKKRKRHRPKIRVRQDCGEVTHYH